MKILLEKLRLSKGQWGLLASAFSNISQAVIIFSAAAFFVPEVARLPKDFSRAAAIVFFIAGLIILFIAVTMKKRSE